MKHNLLIPVLGVASAGLAAAQGLYNIMPFDDDAPDTLPLHWTVAANLGYDSNPSPIGSDLSGYNTDGSGYVSGSIQANYAVKDPQTTWDVWGRVGIVYYFQKIQQTDALGRPVGDADDTYFNGGAGFNVTHNVNERVRLRSRSNLRYEQEPDYDYGIAADRRVGSYLRYSTDNSLGYRWSERFGTVTGFRINGVRYDDVKDVDYYTTTLYNQFRYRTSETTVLTASYRYGFQNNDSRSDSNSQYLLVGAEHEFSQSTVGVVRFGGQYFQPDVGSDTWVPYFEGTLKTQVNEQFGVRAFAYYGLDDRGNGLWTHNAGEPATFVGFNERNVFRFGAQGSYQVSEPLTLFGGLNYVFTGYKDGVFSVGPFFGSASDYDENLFNINFGGSLQVAENVYMTGSYNYTKSTADTDLREYDRHRIQVGVQATF